MICKHCGKVTSEKSLFCNICGKAQGDSKEISDINEGKSFSKKYLMYGVLGIVVVVSSIFLLFRNNAVNEFMQSRDKENISRHAESENEVEEKIDQEKAQKIADEKVERDMKIVNIMIDQIKSEIYSPANLQINEIIIERLEVTGVAFIDVDFSAINQLGGYKRYYAKAIFRGQELESESFAINEFRGVYEIAEITLHGGGGYYFDVKLLDVN